MRIRYYSEKTVKRIISWVCPGTYFIEDIKDRIKRAKHISIPDKHGRIVDLDKVLDWLINEKKVFSMAMSAKVDKALSDAPVILEASATAPSRNHTCPYYQGVCGLDDDFLCYCHNSYEMCDTYKDAGTDKQEEQLLEED